MKNVDGKIKTDKKEEILVCLISCCRNISLNEDKRSDLQSTYIKQNLKLYCRTSHYINLYNMIQNLEEIKYCL